jgi:hypothetical protein
MAIASTTFVVTPANPRLPRRNGEVLGVALDQTIAGHSGGDDKGPHPCGKAEVLADGRLRISTLHTNAGRHAIAMLEDDMLDVVLVADRVRLRP